MGEKQQILTILREELHREKKRQRGIPLRRYLPVACACAIVMTTAYNSAGTGWLLSANVLKLRRSCSSLPSGLPNSAVIASPAMPAGGS